jgi:signal transduction histidine kinase
MDPVRASDPIRPRLVVLWTALVAGTVVLAAEYLIASTEFHSPYRTASVLVMIALAGFELLGDKRTEVLLVGPAVVYASLSIVELKTGLVMSFFDPGTTLGLLILLGILFAATRLNRRVIPVVLFTTGTTAYTLVSLSLQDLPLPHVMGRVLLGVVGQILAMYVTVRIIDRLGASSARNSKSLAIQKALARCSHLLLMSRDDQGMQLALSALLDATDADYAYIDVNRTEDDGRITWQITHDAVGSKVPPGPNSFCSGNYDDMPWVPQELGAGRPVRIRVVDLPEPLRSRYQAEGIRSELAAPIMIEGRWVGTIGFSDFWREGNWTDLETEALTTAADMVAGAWERDRAREGLQELAEAKDQFIAAVSHELRTPLSAVVGFSAALRDAAGSFSTEEISEMAGMISVQSREVADLVDDLLTAERAASGNLTIRTMPTDLEVELNSVVELYSQPPPIEVREPAVVLADGLRTRQIIRNLLTNATRYGGDNVKIEVDVHDGMGQLTVMDDGDGVLGIDEDKIFDPYYRSRNDVAMPDSVGLGLAVARQLARLMSGDLVYRRQDNWTRFELRLPLDPGAPDDPAEITDPASHEDRAYPQDMTGGGQDTQVVPMTV